MDPIGTVPDLDSGRIALGGRELDLRLTRAARKALAQVSKPLTIELELYFSCLIRKRVRFLDAPHEDSVACAALGPQVQMCFRPVMTRACHRAQSHRAHPEVARARLAGRSLVGRIRLLSPRRADPAGRSSRPDDPGPGLSYSPSSFFLTSRS